MATSYQIKEWNKMKDKDLIGLQIKYRGYVYDARKSKNMPVFIDRENDLNEITNILKKRGY